MAGSIAKRERVGADGKRKTVWRARYRDENGREHAAHRPTKAAAQAWLDEQTAAIVGGTWADPARGRQTFGQYFERHKADRMAGDRATHGWKTGTARAVTIAVKSTPFMNQPIAKVTTGDVNRWVSGMRRKGLAESTIRTRFNYVRAIFGAAVDDRVIGRNPTDGATRVPRVAREVVIPTPAQVGALMAAAGKDFALFIAVCAFAGLRIGEASALRLSDVDLKGRTLTVAQQAQHEGGAIEFRNPKSKKQRTVFIPDALADMILDHAITHELTGEAYLWGDAQGQPLHPNTLRGRWHAACRKAGVKGLRVHDLRHFYASGLFAAGCDVVTVQTALGHATADVTLKTYSHVWKPTVEDRTRKAAAGLMSDSCGPSADQSPTPTP